MSHRYAKDNDKKQINDEVFKVKLDTGYVSSMRTRNTTQEKNVYVHIKNCITNKKFPRRLFCPLLCRVRMCRSQSVLQGESLF